MSRDSVSAADDLEAHECAIDVAEAATLESLVVAVVRAYALPRISGGRATWCLASGWPIAIVAQEWTQPQMVRHWPPRTVEDCSRTADGVVRMHLTYLAQIAPDAALEVLSRVRLEH